MKHTEQIYLWLSQISFKINHSDSSPKIWHRYNRDNSIIRLLHASENMHHIFRIKSFLMWTLNYYYNGENFRNVQSSIFDIYPSPTSDIMSFLLCFLQNCMLQKWFSNLLPSTSCLLQKTYPTFSPIKEWKDKNKTLMSIRSEEV